MQSGGIPHDFTLSMSSVYRSMLSDYNAHEPIEESMNGRVMCEAE
jgi:hypothetical protein